MASSLLTTAGDCSSRRHAGYPVAMVDEVLLSSLRHGRYVLRAFCTRGECNCSWEVDVAQAVQNSWRYSSHGVETKAPMPPMRCADLHDSHLSEVNLVRSEGKPRQLPSGVILRQWIAFQIPITISTHPTTTTANAATIRLNPPTSLRGNENGTRINPARPAAATIPTITNAIPAKIVIVPPIFRPEVRSGFLLNKEKPRQLPGGVLSREC